MDTSVNLPPSPSVDPHRRSHILLVASLVLLLVAAFLVRFQSQHRPTPAITQNVPSPTPVPAFSTSDSSTLIYAQPIKTVKSGDRNWPTYRLFRKTKSSPTETLADIGGVNADITGFLLSPDRSFLIISLSYKVQKLDLNTKLLTDLVTLNYESYRPSTLSPDASRLMVWDQGYNPESKFRVIIYDLVAGQISQTLEGHAPEGPGFVPEVWRPDGKVVLSQPLGEIALAWVYDLNTNSLTQLPGDQLVGYTSSRGTYMAQPQNTVDDPCNEFMGTDTGHFLILDPVTGAEIDRIGDDQSVIRFAAFSPDETQILYYTLPPVTGISNQLPYEEFSQKCMAFGQTQNKESRYYVKTIKGVIAPADESQLRRSWNRPSHGEIVYNYDTNSYELKFYGETLHTDTPENPMSQIIAEYYQ